MASTSNVNWSNVQVPIFSGENYEFWNIKMKTLFVSIDLWEMVETDYHVPESTSNLIEAQQRELKENKSKDAGALGMIQRGVSEAFFPRIMGATRAKEAWDILQAEFQGDKKPTNKETKAAQYSQYNDLYRALQSGNWIAAKEFLEHRSDAVSARITHKGYTALHIAVAAGHEHIVDELVKLMSKENLEIRDNDGFTALTEAAVGGKYAMAQCMLRKNEKLTSIASPEGHLPVVTALSYGHVETARYLYFLTPPEDLEPEKGYNGANLFIDAISTGTLDIALDLIQSCPRLALAKNGYGNSSSLALASTPHAFPSGNRLVFWKRWIYKYCIHIQPADRAAHETRLNIAKLEKDQRDQVKTIGSVRTLWRHLVSNVLNFLGIEQLYEMKLIHVQSHELLCGMCKEISNSNDQQRKDSYVYEAIIRAIKSGIIEFVSEMLRENPDLVWTKDGKKRNIFSLAVLHRQATILSLLLELHLKNALTCSIDVNRDGMLHMAGMPAESTMLNCIPGAALQMQRELQWFKEVENIIHPKVRESINKDGLTPRELFTKNHKAMLKEGEQWMKDTATSCTVVGALIVTIMFAAAFTVPGGNNQDTGLPLFLKENWFMVFIISDAMSLFSSSTSVLMFLGILTSRYAEDDFLKSLPTKMIIGLSTLFFSIAAMMIAFSAALLIMLREQAWIVDPVICFASVPVILFVMMQFPLLVEMSISTYGPGIFKRKMKLSFN